MLRQRGQDGKRIADWRRTHWPSPRYLADRRQTGSLPCLEEQRRRLPRQQHKREKVCRAGVFSFRNESSFVSSITVKLPSLRPCPSIASRPALWSHCLPLSSQIGFDFFLIKAASSLIYKRRECFLKVQRQLVVSSPPTPTHVHLSGDCPRNSPS